MEYFDYIIPCGISDHEMTSMELEKNKQFIYKHLDQVIKDKFLKEFNYLLENEYEI